MKSTFRIYCTCRLPDTGDKAHSVMPGFTSYTCRDPNWTKSLGTFGFVANVISSGFSFCYLYSVSVVIPAYTLHIPGTHTMFCVFWTPDPTRKEGSGKYNLARKCPVGMSQFLNSANFLFQIFNAIGQVLLRFSKFLFYRIFTSCHWSNSNVAWLAEVMFFSSSTPTAAFQHSRHFRARLFPRLFLTGWVWSPDYGVMSCLYQSCEVALRSERMHARPRV